VAALVVCWDGNIDEFSWRVCVAKSNDGNINVGGFFDGLSVGAWVSNDDQSRFLERAGDVVGEISRSKATCDCDRAGVSSEFEDSSLAIRTGGDDTDVGWVVDRGDNTRRENDFLPVVTNPSVNAQR